MFSCCKQTNRRFCINAIFDNGTASRESQCLYQYYSIKINEGLIMKGSVDSKSGVLTDWPTGSFPRQKVSLQKVVMVKALKSAWASMQSNKGPSLSNLNITGQCRAYQPRAKVMMRLWVYRIPFLP